MANKKYRFTKARERALKKARKKWSNMSKKERAKRMPGGRGKISKR